jgi:hypothetical protein
LVKAALMGTAVVSGDEDADVDAEEASATGVAAGHHGVGVVHSLGNRHLRGLSGFAQCLNEIASRLIGVMHEVQGWSGILQKLSLAVVTGVLGIRYWVQLCTLRPLGTCDAFL